MKTIPRRMFLKRLAKYTLGLATVSATSGAYGYWVEPHWLDIQHIEMPLLGLPPEFDGYRIAQISDLHFGPEVTGEMIQPVIDQVLALQPDLVVVTGDFATGLRRGIRYTKETLWRLKDSINDGVIGILGNHDWWTDGEAIAQAAQQVGVKMLINSSTTIYRSKAQLYVAGIDSYYQNRARLSQAMQNVPVNGVTILLAHEPDFADVADADTRIRLQLSGHSHGGQVRVPGIGALFLPRYGEKYSIGLYQLQSLKVYTNRGVGLLAPAVRFNCRPELTHITLRGAA